MRSESSQKQPQLQPQSQRGLVAKSGAASRIISTAKSLARATGSPSSSAGSSSKSSSMDKNGARMRHPTGGEDSLMASGKDGSGSVSPCLGGRPGIGRFRLDDTPKASGGHGLLAASEFGGEDGLECPVCWEAFNDQENTPYVLWCGHTLCKTCVMGLRWAVIKLPGLSLQLPLFIQCPWCQFLTARMQWKGSLRLPCKNYFVLWIVESAKAGSVKQRPHSPSANVFSNVAFTPSSPAGAYCHHGHLDNLRPRRLLQTQAPSENMEGSLDWGLLRQWCARMVMLFVQFTAKLPLVLLLLFIVFYVLPFSSLVLALYCVITVVFAVPCFLIVYFSYPSLNWLVREILT